MMNEDMKSELQAQANLVASRYEAVHSGVLQEPQSQASEAGNKWSKSFKEAKSKAAERSGNDLER